MCTYLTEKIAVDGSGKGAQGWFGLTRGDRLRRPPGTRAIRPHREHRLPQPGARSVGAGRARVDRGNRAGAGGGDSPGHRSPPRRGWLRRTSNPGYAGPLTRAMSTAGATHRRRYARNASPRRGGRPGSRTNDWMIRSRCSASSSSSASVKPSAGHVDVEAPQHRVRELQGDVGRHRLGVRVGSAGNDQQPDVLVLRQPLERRGDGLGHGFDGIGDARAGARPAGRGSVRPRALPRPPAGRPCWGSTGTPSAG